MLLCIVRASSTAMCWTFGSRLAPLLRACSHANNEPNSVILLSNRLRTPLAVLLLVIGNACGSDAGGKSSATGKPGGSAPARTNEANGEVVIHADHRAGNQQLQDAE